MITIFQLLSDYPDSSGFYVHQTTKVRVSRFLDEGIVVDTRSDDIKHGFIPNCYLKMKSELTLGSSVYVIYLGQNESYLLFAEENTLQEKPTQDILEYNKLWMHEQKFLEKNRSKIIHNFNDLFPNPSADSLKILEAILIKYDPIDVANSISKVSRTYTADIGFIKMIEDSLG